MDTGEALDASAEPAAIAPELPLSNVSLFKGAQDRPFLQETVSPVPSTSRNSYSVSLRPDDHDIQNVGRAHGRGRNKGESADDSGTRSHAFVTKVAVKSERKKTSTSNAAHSRSPEGDKSVRPKRKRISQDQLNVLLNLFTQTDTPSFELRENVAQQLGMSNREVQVWFQNRRAKERVNRHKQYTAQPELVQGMSSTGLAGGALAPSAIAETSEDTYTRRKSSSSSSSPTAYQTTASPPPVPQDQWHMSVAGPVAKLSPGVSYNQHLSSVNELVPMQSRSPPGVEIYANQRDPSWFTSEGLPPATGPARPRGTRFLSYQPEPMSRPSQGRPPYWHARSASLSTNGERDAWASYRQQASGLPNSEESLTNLPLPPAYVMPTPTDPSQGRPARETSLHCPDNVQGWERQALPRAMAVDPSLADRRQNRLPPIKLLLDIADAADAQQSMPPGTASSTSSAVPSSSHSLYSPFSHFHIASTEHPAYEVPPAGSYFDVRTITPKNPKEPSSARSR